MIRMCSISSLLDNKGCGLSEKLEQKISQIDAGQLPSCSKPNEEVDFKKFHEVLMNIHGRSGRDSVLAVHNPEDSLTQWEKMTGNNFYFKHRV